MSVRPHTASYYAASAHASAVRPALSGSMDCDVCVVGGGIAGCSAALHLAERGYKVVLLEENRVGWGASGRSGAQAIYGLAAPQSKIKKLVGPANARVIWDVTVEALDLIRDLAYPLPVIAIAELPRMRRRVLLTYLLLTAAALLGLRG